MAESPAEMLMEKWFIDAAPKADDYRHMPVPKPERLAYDSV
jgi:hypothetical protein